mgnify:CR=1 FL=1
MRFLYVMFIKSEIKFFKRQKIATQVHNCSKAFDTKKMHQCNFKLQERVNFFLSFMVTFTEGLVLTVIYAYSEMELRKQGQAQRLL